MAETRDLTLLLNARIPIVVIESHDEKRVLSLLARFAISHGLESWEWTATRGLMRGGLTRRPNREPELTDADALLAHIAAKEGPALYALCDLHPFLNGEPLNVRRLKDIALDYEQLQNTLVLISHKLEVPAELGRHTATVNLRLPSDDELMGMVREQAKEWSKANRGQKVKTDGDTLKQLIANLRGVSHADARILIRHAIFTDGAITESDLPQLNRLKFDLLDSEGVLRFEYDTQPFTNIGGLHNLKHWLDKRRDAFIENHSDRPKGLMLLGVQGGGKSLAAKAVAGQWGVPLLRLDFGALYNKFFGETERNLRNSLAQAEMMAPCVLWMDEVEKGLATGQSDNATSQRVLGTLLTWMAENDKPVFIVATSNDVTGLPPELMRKGRLDEVFFVDLPETDVRREIFEIHLNKRELAPEQFDLERLASGSVGFTGAEIEEVVVSARYLAARGDGQLTTDDILGAIGRTQPISVLRAESINALRLWARDRAVPA